MEKTAKRKKSRRERLTRLAQTMVRYASPDVYFVHNEGLQQVNSPPSEPREYVCIAPDQIFALARMGSKSVLMHRSGS